MASSVRSISIWVHASTRPSVAERAATFDQAVVAVALDDQHRVDEQVDAEAVALEHHAHRVDEERHVVRDDQQHRVRRVPAVAIAIRRQHLGQRLPDGPDAGEGEVGDGDGVDVVELALVDVALRQLGVVEGQEPDEEPVVGLAEGGQVAEAAQHLGHAVPGR